MIRLVLLILTTSWVAQAAFSNGYTYRRLLTIQAAQVSGGPHTDFPVLFLGTHAWLATTSNGGNVESASGHDIRFETTGGTKLDHDVERWIATTGETVMWIRIPSLSTTSTFYIYYGNASQASAEENKDGTWASAFGGIYHLETDPSTTCSGTKEACDRSGNDNHADSTSGASGQLVNGKVGKALDFGTGANLILTLPDAAGLNVATTFTFTFWFKMTGEANNRTFYSSGNQANKYNLVKTNTDKSNFSETGIADNISTNVIADGTWRYVAFVKDGDSGTNLTHYRDGATNGTHSVGSVTAPTGTKSLGGMGSVGAQIDEFRVANVARSTAWILTEFNNQNDPSAFYTIGSEETNAAAGFIPAIINQPAQ